MGDASEARLSPGSGGKNGWRFASLCAGDATPRLISFERTLQNGRELSWLMKKCDYCGCLNEDALETCRECGSPILAGQPKPEPAPRENEPADAEIPLGSFAQKQGNAIILKCRTPREAYLVKEELEEADIIAILPEADVLALEYRQHGYVPVRVSAKAYESIPDLRSVVEFQYKKVRSDQPLPAVGKFVAMGCGVVPVPGALVFAWLSSSYRASGYETAGRQFRLWFIFGISLWILGILGVILSALLST